MEGQGADTTFLALKAPTVDLPSDKSIETHVGVKQKGSVFEKTITHQEVAHHNLMKDLTVHVEADQVEGVHPTLNQAVLNLQASLTKLISQEEFAATLQTIVHKQVVGSAIDPGLAMVVGLAAGLATCGWGSALMNALAESMFGMVSVASATGAATMVPVVSLSSLGVAMADAGLSAICSQAASSLMRTGSLKEMSQELTSSQFAKSLTITLTSAGLCQHLGGMLKIDMHPGLSALTDPGKQIQFMDFFQANALKTIVETPLQCLMGRASVEEAVKNGVKNLGVNTVASYASYHIGRLYADPNKPMGYFEHKALHGSVGALSGWLLDSSTKGLISGAIGAVVSEVVMDERREVAKEKALDILAKAEKEGRSLKDGKFQLELYKALSSDLAFAKISGATVAALLGQDPSIAAHTSTNAVENNAIIQAIQVGLIAYGVYDVIKTHQEEGPKAALAKVAIDGAITVATVGAGKMVFRVAELSAPMAEMVWQAYILQNPGFAQVMTKVFVPLGKGLAKAKELYLTADGALSEAWAKGMQKLTRSEGKSVASLSKASPSSTVSYRQIIDARIKWNKGIKDQGIPWEDYLETQLPKGSRLPKNFKTFDFYVEETGTAISAKTLNTTTSSKLADPTKIYNSLKKNIDAAEGFIEHSFDRMRLTSSKITSRELHVAIPQGTTPTQWVEIERAIEYGRMKDVIVKITETL